MLRFAKAPQEEREIKISFFSKEPIRCPVCDTSFQREEMLSGGGRLIAGPLTDELHRKYEASAKYGAVYPLIYQVTVCPNCWFAALPDDFPRLPRESRLKAEDDREGRIAAVGHVFPSVDFTTCRTLKSGTAATYLALRCYDYYPGEFSPTIKQGITALRCGWLFDELNERYPHQHYDWLALLCKRKARFFYREAITREQTGKEALSGLKYFGPDTDKNYGYEGALYLMALLELKYGPREPEESRREALAESRRTIAKIFGLGKSSREKPGPLLEKARDLYDQLSAELEDEDGE
ncbi:MAG: DUF2225 domain-containing protein [Treponemataceae bacterium]|nr:DUF2225 domain-containing protein [Treponemataceae bacterium]